MTGDSYALASVSVTIEAGADSSYNLTVVYTGKPNSDFTEAHNFTVKNNANATGAFNTTTGINGGASAKDDAWADVGGARIYLDMTKPLAPDVSESGSTDETDHIVVTTGLIPKGGDRKWYTDGWSMSAQPSVQSDDSYYRIYFPRRITPRKRHLPRHIKRSFPISRQSMRAVSTTFSTDTAMPVTQWTRLTCCSRTTVQTRSVITSCT